jgi:hypothetical protein
MDLLSSFLFFFLYLMNFEIEKIKKEWKNKIYRNRNLHVRVEVAIEFLTWLNDEKYNIFSPLLFALLLI